MKRMNGLIRAPAQREIFRSAKLNDVAESRQSAITYSRQLRRAAETPPHRRQRKTLLLNDRDEKLSISPG